MRFQNSLFTATLGALLLAGTAPSMAESTYGYNAAGTGPVSATARVQINVNVPLLILLRVGSAGAATQVVTLGGAFAGGIPGGPAALVAGNSQASTWDGTAPVFSAASTPANVTSYGWTNAAGGGSLTCAVTTPFTGTVLTGASVTVTSTAVAGGGLAHPGTNTSCSGPATTFARNTLVSSTWAYALSAAALAAALPGANSETVTYTATTL